jgi:hypothetical protein
MDDFCPRLHMKFILFDKSCPTKSWHIIVNKMTVCGNWKKKKKKKKNENNKQICQSQVKTPIARLQIRTLSI